MRIYPHNQDIPEKMEVGVQLFKGMEDEQFDQWITSLPKEGGRAYIEGDHNAVSFSPSGYFRPLGWGVIVVLDVRYHSDRQLDAASAWYEATGLMINSWMTFNKVPLAKNLPIEVEMALAHQPRKWIS